ncbi:hypothetical protein ACFPK9_05570 [Rubritalea spongiae]|uniref:Uncharacterized protein n=1 Tax=Rubritalea spongiae TaxID=430797 RepID=A0ABW5E6T5_9BACT
MSKIKGLSLLLLGLGAFTIFCIFINGWVKERKDRRAITIEATSKSAEDEFVGDLLNNSTQLDAIQDSQTGGGSPAPTTTISNTPILQKQWESEPAPNLNDETEVSEEIQRSLEASASLREPKYTDPKSEYNSEFFKKFRAMRDARLKK